MSSSAARTEYSVRLCRRAFFLAMAEALTLATDQATFDAFLRDTYGIDGNMFSVKEARGAATPPRRPALPPRALYCAVIRCCQGQVADPA